MTPIQIRLIEYGLIALALLAAYGAWHHKVYQEGYQAAVAAQAKAVEEGKKQHEKNSDKNAKLSDDLARRKYCSRVRDASLSVCLHDLARFSP